MEQSAGKKDRVLALISRSTKKEIKLNRLFGWLKEYRRLATRYDKTASSFMAIIQLAIVKFFFKKYSSDTA